MELETLLLEENKGVATITLNRPDVLNAWNEKMREELFSTFEYVATNEDIRVAVYTGAGRAFGVGADVKTTFTTKPSMAGHRYGNRLLTDFMTKMERVEKPFLAAINGVCVGGGLELAMGCDLRFCSDSARLGFTENNIGLIPGATGTVRLVRMIGADKAKALIFNAELIDAGESLRLGLVTKVVPHGELMAYTMEYAEKLANKAPQALGLAKLVILNAINTDAQSAHAYETMAQSILRRTQDHEEGVAAFRERRKPNFKGE